MSHRRRWAAVRVVIAITPLFALSPLHAQGLYRSMTAGQIFAGACTGSTNGSALIRGGADLFTTGFSASQPHYACETDTGSLPQSATSHVANQGTQSLAASSQSSFGTAKVYAEQHVRRWELEDFRFPISRATAGWVDALTISDPLLTGQTGTFTANVHVTGSLYAMNDKGRAQFEVRTFQGGSTFGSAVLDVTKGNDPNTYVIDQLLPVTFSFVFGTAMKIGVFATAEGGVRAETSGGNFAPGDSFSDFGHTVVWEGIIGMMAGTTVVRGASITSASGNDWFLGPQATVPEPGTWMLLGTGLVALGVVARAKRRA